MGGWLQRCPLESSTCRGPRGSPRVSNPRTRRLKTTALTIGPSMSLAIYPTLSLGWGVPGAGLRCWGGGGGGSRGGFRLCIPMGTDLVMVSARITHNIQGVWQRDPSVLHDSVEAVEGEAGADSSERASCDESEKFRLRGP